MNLLHINTSDIKGGAAIAIYRLHSALLRAGYGSHILCGRKASLGRDTTAIVPGKLGWIVNAAVGKAFNNLGFPSFGYPAGIFIKSSKWITQWADVVIMGNLHGWYFPIGVLPWLVEKVPVIWSLLDMWALTGHCAYSYECQRWKIGCGSCPDLSEYPELLFDTTRLFWLRKRRIYKKLQGKLVFVVHSEWLKNLLMQSPLTKDFRYEYIPTTADLDVFKPVSKEQSRAALGIDKNEKIVMFSSARLKDKRKGFENIQGIIKEILKKTDIPITLLIVGHRAERLDFSPEIRVKNVGYIEDDNFLSVCYSAADVYLSLSRADNLPNTLVEAASCGVPIVTLDRGGCRETLENTRSGYAVKTLSEVPAAVASILEDDSLRENFSVNARKFAEEKFSMDLQVSRYISLARGLIG